MFHSNSNQVCFYAYNCNTNFLRLNAKVLMFQCDNVMRDHLIAKNRVFFEKSERSIKLLKASEIEFNKLVMGMMH